MAEDTRNIVITIKSETASAESTPKDPDKPETPNDDDGKDGKEGKTDVALLSIVANQAYRYVKQAITSEATYEINKYFTLVDDYETQNDVNNALSLIGTGMSIVSATVSGAILGAKAGPVGAIVGGVVGFVGSVGNSFLTAYRAVDQQSIAMRQANAQLAYTMSKRGASISNGSIGENL